MDELKDIRWKQRFENFNKEYTLLEKYSTKTKLSELEQAGIIQFFSKSLANSLLAPRRSKILQVQAQHQGHILYCSF